MKIAMTYDLRRDYLAMGFSDEDTAEFDSPETVEAIAATLTSLGFEVERVGSLPRLMEALLAGRRWDLVFNIAEGLHGFGREAQIPAVLDWYGIPYVFSDPLTLSLTLHKGMAKRVVRDAGLPTPDFALIDRPRQARELEMLFPVFVKPVAEGTGMGVDNASKVRDRAELERVCARLIERFSQPALVESFLPGREVTVGIVGTGEHARSLGVLEVSLNQRAEPGAYGYVNKEEYETRVDYHLVEDGVAPAAERLALDCWRALGCRDGGRVDLKLDAMSRPNFLEVNPLAGLHPRRSDLPILCSKIGLTYRDLMDLIMKSALERVAPRSQRRSRAA